MTLLLGAESGLHPVSKGVPDPRARTLLIDLIDILCNSDAVCLVLPSDKAYAPKLCAELFDFFTPLPRAAVQLHSNIEASIRNSFLHLAFNQGQTLKQWAQFQATNPIVTSSHFQRMSAIASGKDQERRLISDDAIELWNYPKRRRHPFLNLLSNDWSDIQLPLNYRAEAKKFDSTGDFLLCYAFDVYRRGWQYQKNSHSMNATYFPHYIRDAALMGLPNIWARKASEWRRYWSWGTYVLEVLEEDGYKHLRSPEGLAEIVRNLKASIEKTECPRWVSIPTFSRLSNRYARYLGHHLNETAQAASLPLLFNRKKGTNAHSILEDIGSVVSHDLGIGIHAMKLVYRAVHAMRNSVYPYTDNAETRLRHALHPVLKGRLIRRGLVGEMLV
jgi:hypothetical protein